METESAVLREAPTEEEINRYVEKVTLDTSYLPDSEREKRIDRFLVLAAVIIATLRHAGVLEETYTPAGRIFLQSGKDLRPIKAIIGSGGYLSLFDLGETLRILFRQVAMGEHESKKRDDKAHIVDQRFSSNARIPLVPKNPLYYRDASYIFPLLGNYAKEYPKEVSRLAIETLVAESNTVLHQEVG